MKQFKKYGTCTLDSRNYIYLAHFYFKIVSLDTDEVLYEEEQPFPERKRKMQIINVRINNDVAIIMNYKCDFVLYKYLPELKQFQKIYTYYQRPGNIERLDIHEIWLVKSGFVFRMNNLNRPNEGLMRYISFDGSIKDYYTKDTRNFLWDQINSIELHDFDENKKNQNMYVFNENFTSEKDIIIKREDLNNLLENRTLEKHFMGLVKVDNQEIGIFKEIKSILFKKYVSGHWELLEEKPLCLESAYYNLVIKNNQYGIVEFYPGFFEHKVEFSYDFGNIKKSVNFSHDLYLVHVIYATNKYICFYSGLSRNSVIVLNVDEMEDYMDKSFLK